MDFAIDPPVRTVRGRVVMLVDNGVHGDSRVQKEAQSAAAAGWAVTLLGQSPDGQPQSWLLGGAAVQLVPMPSHLGKRPHEFRRVWLRRPLAYPPTGIAAYRSQRVKAWHLDLEARRAALAQDATAKRYGAVRHGFGLAVLRAEHLAAKAVRRWVSLRYHQLTSANGRDDDSMASMIAPICGSGS